jgi:hypothetical protein
MLRAPVSAFAVPPGLGAKHSGVRIEGLWVGVTDPGELIGAVTRNV